MEDRATLEVRSIVEESLIQAASALQVSGQHLWRVGFSDPTRGKRRGPDLEMKFTCPEDVRPAVFEVACLAKQRLERAPCVQHVLLDPRGLFVTSQAYAVSMKELGLVQCKGCGFFFSEANKGLSRHHTHATEHACREAGLVRSQEASSDVPAQITVKQPASWRVRVADSAAGLQTATCSAVIERDDLKTVKNSSSHEDRETEKAAAAESPEPPPYEKPEGGPRTEALRLAEAGDLAALQALKARGVDLRAQRDRHGSGALLWASGAGQLEVVRWLVEACGFDPSEAPPKHGRMALHWAARNGHLEVARFLVAQGGVDPARPTTDGDTPFMLAVWQGHLPVARWLVEACGADPHAKNRFGCNACFKAARMDGARSSLHVLDYVLRLGCDWAALNANGHSVLHKAATYGRADVVEHLLACTACGEDRTLFGLAPGTNEAPSDMARYNGFVELAARLRHIEDTLWLVPTIWQGPLSPEPEPEHSSAPPEN